MFKLTSPSATQYEAQGNAFDPDLHMIENSRDAWAVQWLGRLVEKYDASIVAHFLAHDATTGDISLEVQFGKDAQGRELRRQCLNEYRKGPPRRPRAGYDRSRLHQRLLARRFYRLPDGRDFLLLGKWDGHGNRWGKVQDGPPHPDGTITVRNEIVPEELLRRCLLVPKEEAPFSMVR
jgi:hypothetical protein